MEGTPENQPIISREEVALNKLSDPEATDGVYWHATHVKKLPRILQEGLIAEDFATRIGRPINRWLNSLRNKKYVSLMDANDQWPEEHVTPLVAILVKPLVKPVSVFSVPSREEDYWPPKGEVLVKNRIAPREFIGLVICESKNEDTNYQDPIEKSIVVEQIEKVDPKFALPVYFKGNLVWPIKMSRRQILSSLSKSINSK